MVEEVKDSNNNDIEQLDIRICLWYFWDIVIIDKF